MSRSAEVKWCDACLWRTKHQGGVCLACHPEVEVKQGIRLSRREVVKREQAPLFDDPGVGRKPQ